jgi:hypothetical protein
MYNLYQGHENSVVSSLCDGEEVQQGVPWEYKFDDSIFFDSITSCIMFNGLD